MPTIANNLLDIVLLVLLWLLGAGLGRVALDLLGVSAHLTAAERLLLGAALGLGAVSYGVLLVGWAGLLNPFAIGGLLLVLLVLAATQARGLLADVGATLGSVGRCFRQPVPALLLLLIIFAAILTMISALAPPTDWDPMVYHLAFPKQYIEAGRVFDVLYDHRGEFPENSEMLYTLALLFGRQGLTGLLHWSMALASAVAICSFCRTRLVASRSFALLAGAIFFTTALVLEQTTTENVDLNVAFYNFAALYAFFVWIGSKLADAPTEMTGALLLTGILAGLSYGTKQSSVVNGVAIAVLIIWWLLIAERRSAAATAKALLIYGATALATLFIWPLRAWLASGNPVWPAAYSIFGGKAWSETDANYQYYGYNVLYGMRYPTGTKWDALGTTQPQDFFSTYFAWLWNATMFPDKFDAVGKRSYYLGPLYLGLLPIGAIMGLLRGVKSRSPLLLLSIYAGVYLLGWLFFIHHMSRFFLFALPVLAILAAAAAYLLMGLPISEIEKRQPAPYAPLVAAIIAIFLLLGPLDQLPITNRSLGVVFGAQTQAEYLTNGWKPYATLAWANTNLPPDAHVLMGWGALGYYLDRPYIYAEHAPEYVGRYYNRSGDDFRARLRELGITHIIIAYPAQIPIRQVFPPDFISDDGKYTRRISPDTLIWKVYVLKE